MICIECGKQMKEKVIRKGGYFRSKIIRYTCECGFETSGESGTDRLKNDALDEETREHLKNEKGKFNEPFVNPDEI